MKKIMISFLIGILLISMTACGNTVTEKQTVSTTLKNNYNSFFKDSVFLGDFIVGGLSFYGALEDSKVIGEAGKTAEFALENIDDLVSRKPKNVFMLLGQCDVLWPTENPKEYFVTHYTKLVQSIKDKLPESKIYVMSIPPVTADAEKQEPRFKTIKDFNDAINSIAAAEEVNYIDLYPLIEKNKNLYDKNGITFKQNFYSIWLDYLINNLK